MATYLTRLHHNEWCELTCRDCRGPALYRCLDCICRPAFCPACCRDAHHNTPFHRIQQWSGEYFRRACLSDVGVEVRLGHLGKECPCNLSPTPATASQPSTSRLPSPLPGPAAGDSTNAVNIPDDEAGVIDDDKDDAEVWADLEADGEDGNVADLPAPLTHDLRPTFGGTGVRLFSIVDVTGVHQICVRWCMCEDALPVDEQLLANGLYPATSRQPRTAFTFAVLDDFLLASKECKASANSYWAKISRTTNNAFPHLVPVSADGNVPETTLTSIWHSLVERPSSRTSIALPGSGARSSCKSMAGQGTPTTSPAARWPFSARRVRPPARRTATRSS